MKTIIGLVVLLASVQAFATVTMWPGGVSPKDQCFPYITSDFFFSHDSLTSYFVAVQNQEVCRANRK